MGLVRARPLENKILERRSICGGIWKANGTERGMRFGNKAAQIFSSAQENVLLLLVRFSVLENYIGLINKNGKALLNSLTV